MIIGFRFCSKCRKAIVLDYYPQDRSIVDEIDILEYEHQLNLCNTCQFEFATCDTQHIKFGECVGNDNVIECKKYKPLKA